MKTILTLFFSLTLTLNLLNSQINCQMSDFEVVVYDENNMRINYTPLTRIETTMLIEVPESTNGGTYYLQLITTDGKIDSRPFVKIE